MQSTVTLVGNLVTDVTLRETTAGVVANFRLAVSNGYLDKRTQQYVERTTYLGISAWRRLGENVAASLHKGQPVVVVGRLRQREFEREGQKITLIEVDADLVGHDLARGSAEFARNPRGPQTADLTRAEETPGLSSVPEPRFEEGSTPTWLAPGVPVAEPAA